MIVVDTNLLVYLFLPGERTADAEQVFQRDPVWVAPLLWRSEFRNVLAFYLRRGLLSLDAALALVQRAETLMQGREYNITSAHVLDWVAGSPCSAYDCEFVALAADLGIALITADRKILSAFPQVAVAPDHFQ